MWPTIIQRIISHMGMINHGDHGQPSLAIINHHYSPWMITIISPYEPWSTPHDFPSPTMAENSVSKALICGPRATFHGDRHLEETTNAKGIMVVHQG